MEHFPNWEAFLEWKEREESASKCYFSRPTGEVTVKEGTSCKYKVLLKYRNSKKKMGEGIFGHSEPSEIYLLQNITILRFSIYIITHAGAR